MARAGLGRAGCPLTPRKGARSGVATKRTPAVAPLVRPRAHLEVAAFGDDNLGAHVSRTRRGRSKERLWGSRWDRLGSRSSERLPTRRLSTTLGDDVPGLAVRSQVWRCRRQSVALRNADATVIRASRNSHRSKTAACPASRIAPVLWPTWGRGSRSSQVAAQGEPANQDHGSGQKARTSARARVGAATGSQPKPAGDREDARLRSSDPNPTWWRRYSMPAC